MKNLWKWLLVLALIATMCCGIAVADVIVKASVNELALFQNARKSELDGFNYTFSITDQALSINTSTVPEGWSLKVKIRYLDPEMDYESYTDTTVYPTTDDDRQKWTGEIPSYATNGPEVTTVTLTYYPDDSDIIETVEYRDGIFYSWSITDDSKQVSLTYNGSVYYYEIEIAIDDAIRIRYNADGWLTEIRYKYYNDEYNELRTYVYDAASILVSATVTTDDDQYSYYPDTGWYHDDTPCTPPEMAEEVLADAASKSAEIKVSDISSTLVDGVLTISGTGEIEDNAFKNRNDFHTVIIEEGITAIGSEAFYNCDNLISITLPNSIATIGRLAFYGSGLTEVTIPESVTTIDGWAFCCCENLTTVMIAEGVTSIGDNAFSGCYNLTTVSLPDSVNFIDEEAFNNYYTSYYCNQDSYAAEWLSKNDLCFYKPGANYAIQWMYTDDTVSGKMLCRVDTSVTSFEIPDGITFIAYDAFAGCDGLTAVTIPTSVKSISSGAFAGRDALSIVYYNGTIAQAGEISIDSDGNDALFSATWHCSDGTKNWRFTYETVNDEIIITGYIGSENWFIIPSSIDGYPVTTIASVAADDETKARITGVTISNGVTTIGANAFTDLNNLESVDLPASLTTIGAGAFSGCTSLKYLTIPASVTSIGENAFNECGGSKGITLRVTKNSPAHQYAMEHSINYLAFSEHEESSIFPESSHPYESHEAQTWTYPSDASYLKVTFSQDSKLAEGDELIFMYYDEPYLMRSYFGQQISGLTAYIHASGNGFRIRLISNGNNTGNAYGFRITDISEVSPDEYREPHYQVSDGVIISVSGGRYNSDDNNEPLIVPSIIDGQTITGIGSYAFSSNEYMYRVVLPDTVTTIASHAFDICQLFQIKLPSRLKTIGDYAFQWNYLKYSTARSLVIPDGTESIGSYAFAYCSGLKCVSIPESVTYIGANAFAPSEYAEDDITLKVFEGSFAHQYAIENHLKFILRNEDDVEIDGAFKERSYTLNADQTITVEYTCQGEAKWVIDLEDEYTIYDSFYNDFTNQITINGSLADTFGTGSFDLHLYAYADGDKILLDTVPLTIHQAQHYGSFDESSYEVAYNSMTYISYTSRGENCYWIIQLDDDTQLYDSFYNPQTNEIPVYGSYYEPGEHTLKLYVYTLDGGMVLKDTAILTIGPAPTIKITTNADTIRLEDTFTLEYSVLVEHDRIVEGRCYGNYIADQYFYSQYNEDTDQDTFQSSITLHASDYPDGGVYKVYIQIETENNWQSKEVLVVVGNALNINGHFEEREYSLTNEETLDIRFSTEGEADWVIQLDDNVHLYDTMYNDPTNEIAFNGSYYDPGVHSLKLYAYTQNGTMLLMDEVPLTITVVAESIAPGQTKTVDITNGGMIKYYSFVPEETAEYEFFSTGGYDTFGYLYDAYMNELDGNDDDDDSNFMIRKTLTAGTQYYFGARMFSSGETGTFTVKLLHTGYSDNLTAQAVGDTRLSVTPYSSLSLEVTASCEHGAPYYQWYYQDHMSQYEWNWEWTAIDGATSSILNINTVNSKCGYCCLVTDDYGNEIRIEYDITIDNGLTAEANGIFDLDFWAGGGEFTNKIIVPYGGTGTAIVTASCDEGELTYVWENQGSDDGEDSVMEETGPSVTIENITGHRLIHCTVSDMFGNSEGFRFDLMPDYTISNASADVYINDSPVKTITADDTISISPGDQITVTIQTEAEQWTPTYSFHVEGAEDSDDEEYDDTCVIEAGTQSVYIDCYAGPSELEQTLLFRIACEIENELRVTAAADEIQHVAPGDTVTLAVTAASQDNQLTYNWTSRKASYDSLSTGSSYSFTAQGSDVYTCTVRDTYGTTRTISFLVIVGQPQTLSLNQSLALEHDSGYVAFLSFTPSENGTYQLTSTGDEDVFASLYHGTKLIKNDQMSRYGFNIRLEADLQADTEYLYYILFDEDSSITVTLTRVGEQTPVDYTYTIDNGHAVITAYTGSDTDIVVPSEINGYPVVGIASIGANPDESDNPANNLQNVTVSEGITYIGDSAFAQCWELRSIGLPETLTSIGARAFAECGELASISIGKNVNLIGTRAFESCSSLTAITVDPVNQNYASADGVLFDKAMQTLIRCPGKKSGTYTVPNGVTAIADYAFSRCDRLTRVTLSGSVKTIGTHAFEECSNLQTVDLSAAIETIGDLAFNYANLVTVNYAGTMEDAARITVGSDNNTLFSVGLTCTDGTYYFPRSGEYGDHITWSFADNTVIITCNGALNTVDDAPFPWRYFSNGIRHVILQGNVTSIAKDAFSGFENIISVSLPNTVTTIGTNAFAYCSNLASIDIPENVTQIAVNAFYRCFELKSINVVEANTVYSSVDGVLYNKAQNDMLICPSGITGTHTVPDGVTVIRSQAFSDCSYLTAVTLPETVTNIEGLAFYECSSLERVLIPSSVINIGNNAFRYCSKNLTLIVEEGSIAQQYAIDNNINYELNKPPIVFTLPSSLKTIEAEAFVGVQADVFVIPANVTSIDPTAFSSGVKLRVKEGSYAETFAIENHFDYEYYN